MLLFPDPRPLVERLGREFFLRAPQCPGVYLMRDAAEVVLYVGKAKNLRKRLASYRVANPDRLRRRHLRLLRSVSRIEVQPCADEAAALDRESELLLRLRPRFNRAGTWPAPPRFVAWRMSEQMLELAVTPTVEPGWNSYGPLGTSAVILRAALARLLWCAAHPDSKIADLPEGWFTGRFLQTVCVPLPAEGVAETPQVSTLLATIFQGNAAPFVEWIRERTDGQDHPFDRAVREADLEVVVQFSGRAEKLRRGG